MARKLKKDIQIVWSRLSRTDILNDVFVQNEFHKRKLKIQKAGTVTLVFKDSGKVHIHGESSTESHSAQVAIMKHLIKNDIVDKEDSYDE